jgi:2-polyprenyl-3-methyl-5-hydroxy-6-metoxy-1,4-benzoquinol methylase
VGAGNSQLTEELLQEGYLNITSIDISSVCVKAMQERNSHCPHPPAYLLMDVRNMLFPPSSFDAVIDKATLDSVLVDLSPSSAARTAPPAAIK